MATVVGNTTPQAWRMRMVASRLQAEQVIAYPTEGVWGLGCLPQSRTAVERLLELKQRPWQKGLLLVASDLAQLAPYLGDVSPVQYAELDSVWPGPVTYLVPCSKKVPAWIRGESDRVGVRVSAHPLVRALCEALGQPLVSTSANPAGKAPALSMLTLQRYFHGRLDYIVPGRLGGQAGASEIRDLVTGVVVRPAGPAVS